VFSIVCSHSTKNKNWSKGFRNDVFGRSPSIGAELINSCNWSLNPPVSELWIFQISGRWEFKSGGVIEGDLGVRRV
jgi:hypothetical protein